MLEQAVLTTSDDARVTLLISENDGGRSGRPDSVFVTVITPLRVCLE